MGAVELALAALAAFAAGGVNAVAGGGTLITFPTLVALGVPPIAANVTNTVALCPGYVGGTLAQSADLQPQKQRLYWVVPLTFIGGLVGGLLLLNTEEKLFRTLVPWLILVASGLLAVQKPFGAWLARYRERRGHGPRTDFSGVVPIFFAAVYGGYFGAGLGVILLAVLGLCMSDSLVKLNALKQAISFSTNVAAALFFVFSGLVLWDVALVMAVGALAGGSLGGRYARKLNPEVLRALVVSAGVIIAAVYFIK